MTHPLRINAVDDDVWHETLRAVHSVRPSTPVAVTYRCRHCGKELGMAGNTDHGPLFHAIWMVPVFSGVVLNGKRLSVGEYERRIGGEVEHESGRRDAEEPHSTIALLRLPPGMAAEYPDLLVRCNNDGDALLDRLTVLDQIERPTAFGIVKVDVRQPHHEYATLRDDLWPPEMPAPQPQRYTQRRRWRPGS